MQKKTSVEFCLVEEHRVRVRERGVWVYRRNFSSEPCHLDINISGLTKEVLIVHIFSSRESSTIAHNVLFNSA